MFIFRQRFISAVDASTSHPLWSGVEDACDDFLYRDVAQPLREPVPPHDAHASMLQLPVLLLLLICLYLLYKLYLTQKKLLCLQREFEALAAEKSGQTDAGITPSQRKPYQHPENVQQVRQSETLDNWQGIISHWKVRSLLTEYDAHTAWEMWRRMWEWKFKVGKKVTATPRAEAWKASLGIPFPDVHIAEDVPTQGVPPSDEGEYADSLRLIAQRRVEVASEFYVWAKCRPTASGLLLTPDEHDTFWFIGDIHGSLSALIKILSLIDRQRDSHQRYTLVFLGDLLDRGKDSWGVVAIVQHLIRHASDSYRIVFIKGNHDVGFSIKDDGTPVSTVSPAEAIEELKQMQNQGDAAMLAKAFSELQRISPCMAEILCPGADAPPGAALLLCHGGLPHADLQEYIFKNILHAHASQLSEPPWVNRGFMQSIGNEDNGQIVRRVEKDFEWVRLSRKSAHIRIDGKSKQSGCSMGFNDVNMYRRLHYLLTGRAITFILRGHTHEDKGYAVYHYHKLYNPTTNANQVQTSCGVLTLTSFEKENKPSSGTSSYAVACWHASRSCIDVYPLF